MAIQHTWSTGTAEVATYKGWEVCLGIR